MPPNVRNIIILRVRVDKDGEEWYGSVQLERADTKPESIGGAYGATPKRARSYAIEQALQEIGIRVGEGKMVIPDCIDIRVVRQRKVTV